MDPNTVAQDVLEEINDGYLDDAESYAEALNTWNERGGFPARPELLRIIAETLADSGEDLSDSPELRRLA